MSESQFLPVNFGGIDEEDFSSFDKSKVLIFPVSYEGTVSYGGGTGAGAQAIIEASRNMELYEEELDAEIYKIGIHTLDELAPQTTPEAMIDALYRRSKELVGTGKFVCMLGGEHSISSPVIRAHAEKYHDLSVLQIDAHADLRDEYDGTKWSHASIMARVVKDLKVPAVQVGIRSLSTDEARSLADLPNTKIFWAKDIVGKTGWIEKVVESLSDNVYLTFDIDALDPSLVATTGTPEPGGLGWYETLELLRAVCAKRRIVGMDLVELAADEQNHAPAFLCAKLLYKIFGYIHGADLPKIRGN